MPQVHRKSAPFALSIVEQNKDNEEYQYVEMSDDEDFKPKPRSKRRATASSNLEPLPGQVSDVGVPLYPLSPLDPNTSQVLVQPLYGMYDVYSAATGTYREPNEYLNLARQIVTGLFQKTIPKEERLAGLQLIESYIAQGFFDEQDLEREVSRHSFSNATSSSDWSNLLSSSTSSSSPEPSSIGFTPMFTNSMNSFGSPPSLQTSDAASVSGFASEPAIVSPSLSLSSSTASSSNSFSPAKYCAFCSKQELSERFSVCGRCTLVSYCSRGCQSQHWATHKLECVKKT